MSTDSFAVGPAPRLALRLAAILPVVAVAVTVGLGLGGPVTAVAAFFVPMMVMGVVGQALLIAERRRHQRLRDQAAARVMDALRRGREAPPYSLYLRPFLVTNQVWVSRELAVGPLYRPAPEERESDLELLLAQAVEPVAPMVALGRPGEAIGAGRIPTADATWQGDLDLLATRAALLVVVPLGTPGTRWEMDFILAHQLLDRTAFVMPPHSTLTDMRQRWGQAAALYRQLGVALPGYAEDGALFLLDPGSGEVRARAGIAAPLSAARLREGLERLLGATWAPAAHPPA